MNKEQSLTGRTTNNVSLLTKEPLITNYYELILKKFSCSSIFFVNFLCVDFVILQK